MNNDIENKLNELLKMKDSLDELNERKQQQAIDDFDEKQKKLKKQYNIWIIICVVILLAGVSGIENNADIYKWNGLFMAIVGLNSAIFIKVSYHIATTKLSVLQELKQLQIQLAKQATTMDD